MFAQDQFGPIVCQKNCNKKKFVHHKCLFHLIIMHSVSQSHNSQQAMLNFQQGQIVGLAHLKQLQGLGSQLGRVRLK